MEYTVYMITVGMREDVLRNAQTGGPMSRPRSACPGQCLNDLNSDQECRRRVCSPVSFGQLLGLSTGRTHNVPGDAATALKSTPLHVESKVCSSAVSFAKARRLRGVVESW